MYDQHSSQDQVYVQSAQQVVLSILQVRGAGGGGWGRAVKLELAWFPGGR